jgi:hypothetical protein
LYSRPPAPMSAIRAPIGRVVLIFIMLQYG